MTDLSDEKLKEAVKFVINHPQRYHRVYDVGIQDWRSVDGLYHISDMAPQDSVLVEIGTYFGESAMFWWKSGKFKKVICIDPYSGNDVVDYPGDAAYTKVKKIADSSDGVMEIMRTTSFEGIPALADRSVDVAYIDGMHDYEHASVEIKLFLPKMKQGGFICGHDYDHQRYPGLVRAVDEAFVRPDITFTDTSWLKKV